MPPRLKQRPDGRYRVKYHGHEFYGKTQSEAFSARDEFIRQEKVRQALPMTVREYALKWLPTHKASVGTKTYNEYARLLDNLVAVSGDTPLSQMAPSDVKAVYNKLLGYSHSTIRKLHMLCVSMWDAAIEDGFATSNPCRSKTAQPHKGTVGTHRVLTPEEDQLLLQVNDPLRPAVLMMRYAGLRRGEVLAIDIDRDVDFLNKEIHVREAVRFYGNSPIVTSPKTSAGLRIVPLLDILEKELEGKHGLAAQSAVGAQMSETAFRRAWDRYINAVEQYMNGCQKRWYGKKREHREPGKQLPAWRDCTIRPHDLRHSYCTMLRDAGVDMKLAMKWLGHADEKMILRVYDHVTEDRIHRETASLEAFLSNGGQNGGLK